MGSGVGGIYENTYGNEKLEGHEAPSRGKPYAREADNRLSSNQNANSSTLEKNAASVKEKYRLHDDGYFAERGSKGHNRVFETSNPVGESREFYKGLSRGGVESEIPGGKGVRTKLDDGAWVNYRVATKTPESPAVQISGSPTELVKNQKVHFLERGEA